MPKNSEYKESVNITAVDRALRVMETISYEDREMGINEIAAKMGEYPSTVYRVISTLMNRGYLYQNPETSKYGLGYKVFVLGRKVELNSTLIRISKPYAEALANEFKESVNVAVRDETRQDGYYAVTIYQVKGSKRTLGVSETIGQSYGCYYSGVGKALLAFSDDLDYRKIMQANIEQYTPYTITDNKAFIEEIEKVKEQGYAIDNQEQEPGLCCIACPVLDRRGRAVMAMSLSGYEGNIRALGFENIAARLKQACNEMSNRIR